MSPVSMEGSGESAPSMGIIYPPREVRNIVDKTASFVARNGVGFEQKIKANEVNNPKFNFLNSGDPYHAYYQHRVKEFMDGKQEEVAQEPKKVPSSVPTSGPTDAVKQKQSDLLKQARKEVEAPPPKDPPPEFEFIADPPSISAFDLDVVKLTAQFVARNGRQFLTSLMQKEQRNYQFDFLRPQHSLFQYFTKLLEQYTKVLIPSKDVSKKLQEEAYDESNIMGSIDYRVRWIKHQEAQKRLEAEQAEKERVSYAQIDWHNFVVVETVDYQPWEVGNFPPPTNPEEVGARVLMQRRVESLPASEKIPQKRTEDGVSGESNTNVEDMEEDSSSEEDDDDVDDSAAPTPMGKPLMAVDAAPAVNQPAMPPPSLPTPGNVEVRKYDPKMAKAKKQAETEEQEEYLVSPITGQRVPASKVQEHMRIGLLDPRWVDERNKQITEKASEDAVFAPGQSIESSLKHLAERRTDIFGVGEEAAQEAAIGKKMGEEERKTAAGSNEVSWDGHSSTAESAARAARANISLTDQIEQIHRAKGLIPEKDVTVGPKPTEPSSNIPAPVIMAPPSSAVAAPPPMPPAAPPTLVSMIPQPAPVQVLVPPAFHPAMPFHPAPPPAPMPHPGEMIQPQMVVGGGDVGGNVEGEPAAKRPRGEDHLMPESEFLARNPNPDVLVRVQCPTMIDKSDWNLNGQLLQIGMTLRDTVSALKAKIHEETGMAPGKQKLQLDSMFLKDANSLAYYNMRSDMAIFLQIKERGGRKK